MIKTLYTHSHLRRPLIQKEKCAHGKGFVSIAFAYALLMSLYVDTGIGCFP
jgi:hypothetical protein